MNPTTIALQRVVVAYPSGNTTAVVFDRLQDTDIKERNAEIIQAWLEKDPDAPQIEQCCFVTAPTNPAATMRIQMFGGEFCGNATRSGIWAWTGGENTTGVVEVSGTDQLLEFSVKDGIVTVQMPLPQSARLTEKVTEGTLITLDGIAHLVVTSAEAREAKSPRALLTELLEANHYNLRESPSVGVSYYDPSTTKATFCVWVNAVDTLFDETACGSGTSAIGIALADKAGTSLVQQIIQPSGEPISTRVDYNDGTARQSTISGAVSILYDGALTLS